MSARHEIGPQPPRRRADFVRGLRCVNPLILLGALALTALVLFVAQQAVLDRTYLRLSEQVLLRSPKDDYMHIVYQVAQLQEQPPAHLPVYYIGGSATRESVRSSETVAQQIAALTGVRTDVYIMGSKQQTLAETLAIVDNLPSGPGVVAIGLNPYRFRISPKKSARQLRGIEFLLDSPSLRAYEEERGTMAFYDRTLIPGIANYTATWVRYRRTTLLRLRLARIPYQLHLFDSTNQLPEAQKRKNAAIVREAVLARPERPDATTKYNLGLLRAIASTGHARGFQVVFVEAPRNKEILGPTWPLDRATYVPPVAAAARRSRAAYIDLNADVQIPDSQFADLSHLLEPGRVVWERHLTEALAPYVRVAAQEE